MSKFLGLGMLGTFPEQEIRYLGLSVGLWQSWHRTEATRIEGEDSQRNGEGGKGKTLGLLRGLPSGVMAEKGSGVALSGTRESPRGLEAWVGFEGKAGSQAHCVWA